MLESVPTETVYSPFASCVAADALAVDSADALAADSEDAAALAWALSEDSCAVADEAAAELEADAADDEAEEAPDDEQPSAAIPNANTKAHANTLAKILFVPIFNSLLLSNVACTRAAPA